MFSSSLLKPVLGLVIVALLIVLSIPFQGSMEEMRGDFKAIEETLYMSPSTLRRLSLGYTGLLADIYWLRALQYFGGKRYREKDSEQLYRYFDVMTDLDPQFVNAYRYGGTFLAETPPIGMGDAERGVKLFEKGRKNNPHNFRLPLEEAFILFLYERDYARAAELFYEASTKPGLSHLRSASLKGMAAVARNRGGDRDLARQIWRYIYETTPNEGRKDWALKNIKKLDSRELEDRLTEALRDYVGKYGELPEGVEEIAEAGLIDGIPADPSGGRFVVARGLEAVRSTAIAREELQQATGFLTARAKRFEQHYGRYPSNMAELRGYVESHSTTEFPEHPLGGEYVYDPETGTVEAPELETLLAEEAASGGE